MLKPVYSPGLRRRTLFWVGTSKDDLGGFPDEVKREMGYALHQAQVGGKSPKAKPLKGMKSGAGVLEIVDDYDGDTFRAVYTVRLESGVYVLHAFQKKSHQGIKTDQGDIERVKERLKDAVAHDASERAKKAR